jgi:hypothetical protein
MRTFSKLLVTVFLIFFTGRLKAQDTLNRLYGTYGVEAGKAGVVLADSTIFALGTSSVFTPMSSQAYLIKLDKHGNILWSKFYGGTGVDDATDMFFDSDSSIYITSNSYNGPVKGYDVKIIKVDQHGNLIWEKAYGTNEWDVPARLIKYDVGKFAVCGYTYSGTGGQKDGMLFTFNDVGDSLSFFTYGGATDDEFTDLVLRNTDTIAVCGITLGANGKKRGWLLEQTIGGTLFSNGKFGASCNNEFNAIAISNTGHYLLGCTSDSLSGGDLNLVGRVMNRNTKSYIEDIILGTVGTNDEHCTDVKLIGGWNHILGTTESFGLGGTDGIMYRFDDYYWVPNAATWGTSQDDYVNSFVPNASGRFTAFGTSQQLYGVSDVWVINCGNTYELSTTLDSQLDINGIHEQAQLESAVNVYPNPFSSTIHLTGNQLAEKIVIADISGKTAVTFMNASSADLSALANGIYLLQVEMKDHGTFTKRIVKH